jgi:hypothetical protein
LVSTHWCLSIAQATEVYPKDMYIVVSPSFKPNLISRRGQDVISGGMERETGDGAFVDPHQLDGLRRRHVPDPDGGVVGCRDHDVLGGVVHNPVHLLGMALQDRNNLGPIKKKLFIDLINQYFQLCFSLRRPFRSSLMFVGKARNIKFNQF